MIAGDTQQKHAGRPQIALHATIVVGRAIMQGNVDLVTWSHNIPQPSLGTDLPTILETKCQIHSTAIPLSTQTTRPKGATSIHKSRNFKNKFDAVTIYKMCGLLYRMADNKTRINKLSKQKLPGWSIPSLRATKGYASSQGEALR